MNMENRTKVNFSLYVPDTQFLEESRNAFDFTFRNFDESLSFEFPLIIDYNYRNRDAVFEMDIVATGITSMRDILNGEKIAFDLPSDLVEKMHINKYKYYVALVKLDVGCDNCRDYYINDCRLLIDDPGRSVKTPFYFVLMRDYYAVSYEEIEKDIDHLGNFLSSENDDNIKSSNIQKSVRREDYISWNEYFMGIAYLSSLRSKDPKTQVGACIVSQDNKILSIGYNGFPIGCSDNEFPWNEDSENKLEIKDHYVVHAELNAILNYKGDLTGSKLYVLLFPCNECAKAIIQAGIKEVIYKNDKDSIKTEAAKRMLKAANIKITQYQPTKRKEIFEF